MTEADRRVLVPLESLPAVHREVNIGFAHLEGEDIVTALGLEPLSSDGTYWGDCPACLRWGFELSLTSDGVSLYCSNGCDDLDGLKRAMRWRVRRWKMAHDEMALPDPDPFVYHDLLNRRVHHPARLADPCPADS